MSICHEVDNSGSIDFVCDTGALVPVFKMVSWQRPQENVAFVRLRIANGARQRWADHVLQRVARMGLAAQDQETRSPSPYVAAAHVVGARSFNALLEVMANDEERLLELIVELTDVEGVLDMEVLRCAPDDTSGFGEIGRRSG